MDNKLPEDGSRWYSISNGRGPYTVICTTNKEDPDGTHPPQVVYEGVNGKKWSRPLSIWYSKMIRH